MVRASVFFLLLLLLPAAARSQQRPAASFGRALAVETLGGTAGSLAGLGVLSATGACGQDDVACILRGIGIVTTVGAGTGAYLAGRIGGTSPSAAGAFGGALAGLLAGAGASKLAQEARAGEPAVVLTFALTQGLASALGSRLLSTAR